ncbi:MAG: amidohydrolase family protein [Phycisphaeraceae bacterium]|nr:amidohydrolase family protein [Phycisphaerae bacterium]MBX3393698.1 amidohydrolase family protein [Phycisphaeraceae bacterium]HRJ49484.1 amidohydrolase family protein [Phycisphaerales bacterium]
MKTGSRRCSPACLGAAVALFVAPASAGHAPSDTHAYVGARVIPISGSEIDRGVLVVRDGKIAAVGAEGSVAVPAGATVHDVMGKVIMPGLVDTHSHVGGIGAADSTGPIQPGVRVYDSINPLDSGFRRVVSGGITTLNVMPGSGHLLSGQTVYLKMRRPEGDPPRTIEALFIRDHAGRPMGGIKMANGTNSIGGAPFPGTRGKSAFLVREQFIRAREYAEKIKSATGEDGVVDESKRPARDLGLEALVDVMEGRTIVHHHTHRADDIITVLRLRDEFGFRVVLHHVSEAWKVADEIASAERSGGVLGCSVILVDAPGGKLEATELSMETGAALARAGATVAYHSDDWITDSRLFLRMAALGVRGGLDRGEALRAMTLAGARMLDLGDRVGSLEPGKDADFIILSGDPLSVYTKIEQTWVEGRKVFDRADPDDHLHQVGGYGAGRDQTPYLCCAGGSGS